MNIKQIKKWDIWHEFFITANKQPKKNNEPNHPKPSRFPVDKHVYFYSPESSNPKHCYGKILKYKYENGAYYYDISTISNRKILIKEDRILQATPELNITEDTSIQIHKPIFNVKKWAYTIKQLRLLLWPIININNDSLFYSLLFVLQNFNVHKDNY